MERPELKANIAHQHIIYYNSKKREARLFHDPC